MLPTEVYVVSHEMQTSGAAVSSDVVQERDRHSMCGGLANSCDYLWAYDIQPPTSSHPLQMSITYILKDMPTWSVQACNNQAFQTHVTVCDMPPMSYVVNTLFKLSNTHLKDNAYMSTASNVAGYILLHMWPRPHVTGTYYIWYGRVTLRATRLQKV